MLGALLVVVMTAPTLTHPATVGRVDTNDGRFSIWNVAWIDHAVTTDPSHLLDANIFHPHTGTLAYVFPVEPGDKEHATEFWADVKDRGKLEAFLKEHAWEETKTTYDIGDGMTLCIKR